MRKEVSIPDVRPVQERSEWFIPGGIYINACEKLRANDPTALQGLHLNKTFPVLSVCAGGKSCLLAADLFQNQGLEAYSLNGGMKNCSLSWNQQNFHFLFLKYFNSGELVKVVYNKRRIDKPFTGIW